MKDLVEILKRAFSDRRTATIIALVVIFGIAGIVALRSSSAATGVALLEAESGTTGGNAGKLSNIAGAGGQSTVQFRAGAVTPPVGGNFKPGFVYRDGRNMMLDGKVYKAPGVNNFALTGCHHGYEPSQAQMDSFFSKMKPNSMVRTWAFDYSNDTLIDRTVASAERNGQKLVLALADGAEYCGAPDYDGGFYSSGFRSGYFSWIRTVVAKHKGSKAIAAWEIMNEPALKADSNPTDMKRFFDETAALIKSIDPDHLVSTGTLAPYQDNFGADEGDCASCFANMHSGPNIDIVSLHEYDYAQSGEIISNHFDAVKEAAETVKKPIIIGETGVTRKSGCISASERGSIYKQKMDAYLTQGASAVFFWGITYPPNESGDICNEEYGSNDPVDGAVMQMFNNYTVPN